MIYSLIFIFPKFVESPGDLVNNMLHFCYYNLILVSNLIFPNSFYFPAEISDVLMHFFSSFSTRLFNISIEIIYNSLSHSFNAWFFCQSGSADYFAS